MRAKYSRESLICRPKVEITEKEKSSGSEGIMTHTPADNITKRGKAVIQEVLWCIHQQKISQKKKSRGSGGTMIPTSAENITKRGKEVIEEALFYLHQKVKCSCTKNITIGKLEAISREGWKCALQNIIIYFRSYYYKLVIRST